MFHWSNRRLASTLACAVAVLAFATPSASGAVGDPFLDGCLTPTAMAPCSAGVGPSKARAVALHPNGRWLYAGTLDPGTGYGVQIFDRDPQSGAVTRRAGPAGCFTTTGSNGQCATVSQVDGKIWDLEVSDDGRNLYVPSETGVLASFAIDQQNGGLQFMGCISPSAAGCTALQGPGGVFTAVATDPVDGSSLYLHATNALYVFSRSTTTGALTQKPGPAGCFTETAAAGCTDAVGLSGNGFQLAFGPDGKQLYTSVQTPGGVALFQRFADGTLLQPTGTAGGCITTTGYSGNAAGQCVDGGDTAMGNAWSATASPDGRHVIVAGASGMTSFTRNAASGLLTEGECYTEGAASGTCAARHGVTAMHAEFTPDGAQLVSSAYNSAKIGFLVRDAATGKLTNRPGTRGCFSANGSGGACEPLAALGTVVDVAISRDGVFAYVTDDLTGMLATFHFDVAPTCEPRSAVATQGAAPAPVTLSCSDRNGDPLTLEVSRAPLTGQVGAIDQTAARVFYSPFAGFTGDDSFEYRATGNGVASAPATVSIKVEPAGAPPASGGGGGGGGSAPPPVDGPKPSSAKLTRQFALRGARTVVLKLRVTDLGAGESVTVRCTGSSKKGCFNNSRTVTPSKGAANLLSLLRTGGKPRRLASGAVLEIRVTKPGAPTRVWRLTFRKKKQPSMALGCLAAGSSKLTSC